ncbi:GvpL/GvpF family gas vesicle protein [Roseibacterium sp. SDUM158017]|uniref:GvpL/GvpF family gas vesicle protein n=1 Tax=Roseicyclus salinarum TaxID=3036773 RepID=UPI0024159260|nr:GvpL/GvpF family gas vesicle protein [Roseibacterium sp. SDUM158017]MDG4648421.1 GvpL/GvpF family gas vesicle protein [Roseibacterium sp. SDUM158017]
MIYLYGLLAPGAAPDAAALAQADGVTGPVRVAATPVGYLIFGDAPARDILPKRRALLAHARVLERCQEHGALLPMRFGMVVEDLQEIIGTLAGNADALTARLAFVEGHAEFGLRVNFSRKSALEATLAADPALAADRRRLLSHARPPHFATAEFGRRLAEALDRRRGAVQKSLAARLAPLCRAHVLATPEDDVQVLHMHALVPPARAEGIARLAQETAAMSGFAPDAEPEIRLVGPVPPFNFVQLTLETARSVAA